MPAVCQFWQHYSRIAKDQLGSAAISNTVRKLRDIGDADVRWSTVAAEEVKASTIADSIAVDRPRDGLAAVKAVIESGGEAVTVEDEEILAAISEMAQLSGVFPEPAAAAPWAAVKQMVGDNKIDADELVVCLVSGSGLKDIGNAEWRLFRRNRANSSSVNRP